MQVGWTTVVVARTNTWSGKTRSSRQGGLIAKTCFSQGTPAVEGPCFYLALLAFVVSFLPLGRRVQVVTQGWSQVLV